LREFDAEVGLDEIVFAEAGEAGEFFGDGGFSASVSVLPFSSASEYSP